MLAYGFLQALVCLFQAYKGGYPILFITLAFLLQPKMKKLAIIGASYLQLPAFLRARELGLYAIGFAWEKGAVAKDFCDKFYPISITEKEQILSICRQEKIDGVLTIASDLAVPTVSYIADQMGLIGNSIDSARISTNKFLMRESFKKAGLNCPPYYLIKPESNLSAISKKIQFPSIVKPVDRSGSTGVSKVNSEQEFLIAARVAIDNSLVKEAIVEGFIEGFEVSVEMISFNGVHYELAITDKETSGQPHFVELAHHQPSTLPAAMQKEIFKETRNGLNALNVLYGASHSEFMVSSKGVFVTEIGARMGGDFIGSDLVYLSTGCDFLKDTILTALGIFAPPQKTLRKCSGVYFYSEKSKEVRNWIDQYPLNPIIFKAELNNEELMPLSQSSCRSGYFIYQDDKKLILKKSG